jgi:flagellar M-ring protein FliF
MAEIVDRDEFDIEQNEENLDSAYRSSQSNSSPSRKGASFVNLNLNKQTIALIIVALVISGVLAFIFLKPNYQHLYSGLSQSDAAAIGSYLQKQKIKFKISNDGESIGVSGTSVPKLKLELASKGLPKGGGVGFEIFDKTNLTVTDFSQKLNYKRALEGELSRTISSLDSVKSAKVHLALAPKSLFKDTQQKSTASVVIIPMFDAVLSDEQVQGIRHLVASAVTDLEPEAVQVTDFSGRSLVSFSDENSKLLAKVQQNETNLRKFERKLEDNLLELLSPILGSGNVLVNVTADMNFDESEMNIETFSPIDDSGEVQEPVVRSEKLIVEKYSKQGAENEGVVGTQNNIPTFTGKKASSKGDEKDYVKEDKTRNYEVSKKVQRIKKATGLVNKISVAVVVNKDLNPSEMSTLRQTVSVAAGLNLERGDQVIVTGIRFSSTPYIDRNQEIMQREEEKKQKQSLVKKYTFFGISTLAGLLIIFVLLLSLKSPIDDKKTKELERLLEQEEIPLLNTIDEKIQEAEEAYQRKLSLDSKPGLTQMKAELSRMAIEDPRTIARGLKAFIDD